VKLTPLPTTLAERAAFADDVRIGLTAPQKWLPPKYLYDAVGSALFEAITQLPEYGLWRAERALLAAHGEDIAARTHAMRVFELGSGSASKTDLLLRPLLARRAVSYCAIDLSASALSMTRHQLAGLAGLSVTTVEADYLQGLDAALRAHEAPGRTLVAFLGSSLGNLDALASLRFLQRICHHLAPGDGLLLGVDLHKPVERLLAAYDDAGGVTRAFNLNLLTRMNRELGADFSHAAFHHVARFNERTADVEMHLEVLRSHVVRCADAGLDVSFREGETIHTESSHKYSIEEMERLAEASGFRLAAEWVDAGAQFASVLLAVPGD